VDTFWEALKNESYADYVERFKKQGHSQQKIDSWWDVAYYDRRAKMTLPLTNP